jgi:hypothetical protein
MDFKNNVMTSTTGKVTGWAKKKGPGAKWAKKKGPGAKWAQKKGFKW